MTQLYQAEQWKYIRQNNATIPGKTMQRYLIGQRNGISQDIPITNTLLVEQHNAAR